MTSTDRAALVALFGATGGVNWVLNQNWDTDAELGTWYGVEVNDEGRVVLLSLTCNNLRGKSLASRPLRRSNRSRTRPMTYHSGCLRAFTGV